MADPADEPRTPPPPGRPGQPLPRLRYTPPGEVPEPPPVGPTPSKSSKAARKTSDRTRSGDAEAPKRRKARAKEDDEPKGVLVEATPTLDTYEARQRTRMAVAAVLLGVVVIAGLLVVRAFRASESDELGEILTADLAGPEPHAVDRQAVEREARVSLADARAYAEQGDAGRTLAQLRHILDTYPQTSAAQEAQEALARGRQGLPLFVDVPLVVAELAEPVEPEPVPVVIAEPVAPAPLNGTSEVQLTPPPVRPAIDQPLANPSQAQPIRFPPGSMPF